MARSSSAIFSESSLASASLDSNSARSSDSASGLAKCSEVLRKREVLSLWSAKPASFVFSSRIC